MRLSIDVFILVLVYRAGSLPFPLLFVFALCRRFFFRGVELAELRKVAKRAHIILDTSEALLANGMVFAADEPWTMEFVVEVGGAERAGGNTSF